MAKGNGAGCGCGALGLLVLFAMCTGGGPDGDSASPYASAGYTSPAVAPPPAVRQDSSEWMYIHGTLNVRAEPKRDARIVRTLSRGDMVRLGPRDANGWARIYSAGSPEGYVYRASDLVRTEAPAATAPESRARGGSRRSSGSRVYHTGPRGGCYYYSSSGRKQYVDRSNCH